MPSIQTGDLAPHVSGVTHDGQPFSLADFRGRQAVVLFFYPKDGTPVCTREACAFRDAYDDFVRAGAAVIGISSDSNERHQEFATSQRLPFLLISDTDGALRKAFGVPNTLAIFPGRVTYVIDKQGIVRHVFNSQLDAGRHVTEALAIVSQLT